MLLVLVPFQISWAVAGEYCQHENGSIMVHFGHHAHHHQSNSDQPDSKHAGNLSKLHSDCGSCHTTILALLLVPSAALAISLPATKLPLRPPDSYKSHIPDGPREPDRIHFA
ncbi:cobalt-zinc-cadmium resistance protein [Undibacterium sp. 14-3-2]|uniref:cobalt-zinc-cadmium resistance protein n=1 Tax=Undibacterium sp. 14-3-2 TaxID=2800129 RepID=UPI00351C4101